MQDMFPGERKRASPFFETPMCSRFLVWARALKFRKCGILGAEKALECENEFRIGATCRLKQCS